jgi:formylglycine-generating enzyme required for sulfatase activity
MKPLIYLLSLLFIFSFSDINEKVFSKKLRKKYSYIPSGEVIVDKEKKEIDGFFMMKSEVSNIDYQEFFAYLKETGNQSNIDIAKVQEKGWEVEAFQKTYFQHPVYNDYPVVNITREAAELYCEFLKLALNNSDEIKGYKVSECRLPTRDEWILAARAGHMMSSYPWGGYYLRNNKGLYMANFNRIGPENISFDRDSKSYKIVDRTVPITPHQINSPAPVFSYLPNDFGLHHMSGNVAEMVSEKGLAVGGGWRSTGFDIRIESTMPFKQFSPEVGFRPLLILEKE